MRTNALVVNTEKLFVLCFVIMLWNILTGLRAVSGIEK